MRKVYSEDSDDNGSFRERCSNGREATEDLGK